MRKNPQNNFSKIRKMSHKNIPLQFLLVLQIAGCGAAAQLTDRRCICRCPDLALINGFDEQIINGQEKRTIYINTKLGPKECNCAAVVEPILDLKANQVNDKELFPP